MAKEKENPYKERFVAEFCNVGTPFSGKMVNGSCGINNTLRLKADELLGDEKINFWDDDWTESFCYFSGGLLGLTLIPIDALLTGVFTVKETFRGINN